MANGWTSGISDDDVLSQFPNAANPLDRMGIDPDAARANPAILERLMSRGGSASPSAASAGAMGGAGGITPTSTPDSGTSKPTTPYGYGMAGLETGRQSLDAASKAASEIPTTPPPDVSRLEAQREKLAVPAPLFDPKTGKRLATTQEYNPDTQQMETVKSAPSVGSRIWRGVRGGLVGLATGGIPGALVGALEPGDIRGGTAYGAPAGAYQRAEARREEQLGATDTGLTNSFKAWKDAVDAAKAKSAEYRSVGTLAKDQTTGATGLLTNNLNTQKLNATVENYKDKVKEKEDQLAQAWQIANQKNATAEERNQAIENIASQRASLAQEALEFTKQKLNTLTDARTLDSQEKEDVNSIEKKYNEGVTGLWNRTFGNKEQEIASTHKMYQDRRAALGLGVAAAPGGKAVHLSVARKLKENLGKTDAQIQSDIKKYGYEVRP